MRHIYINSILNIQFIYVQLYLCSTHLIDFQVTKFLISILQYDNTPIRIINLGNNINQRNYRLEKCNLL